MLQRRYFYGVGLFIGMIIVISGPCGQAEAITIGKSELHPFAAVKETFTDNVFSTAADEKRDRVTIYTPGAALTYPFGVHRLDLSYGAVLTRYDVYQSEKTEDHRAQGALDLHFGGKMSLKLTDAFSRDHEPRSSSTTGFIERYKKNSGGASLVYQLADRSKVQFDYGATAWNFRNSTFRDRREQAFSGYLYYRFLPKTSVFIEQDLVNIDFTESTTPYDNKMTRSLLGLTWEMTSRSRGTIKAGRSEKDFKDPAVPDTSAWTASLDIRHDFTKYTSVLLAGQRSLNESNSLGSSFSITTGAYGEAAHRFGHHLSAMVHGSFGTDRFPGGVAPDPGPRTDRVSSWGGGLNYLIVDGLELSADHTRRARNSNIDVRDYHERQYSVMVSLTL